jgi:hypothetical protein
MKVRRVVTGRRWFGIKISKRQAEGFKGADVIQCLRWTKDILLFFRNVLNYIFVFTMIVQHNTLEKHTLLIFQKDEFIYAIIIGAYKIPGPVLEMSCYLN